jgi:hypothetical protein
MLVFDQRLELLVFFWRPNLLAVLLFIATSHNFDFAFNPKLAGGGRLTFVAGLQNSELLLQN